MGGGGGSDNSAQVSQANAERKKAQARAALNAAFGVTPTAPDASNFIREQKGDGGFLGSLNPFNNDFEDFWNPVESDFLDPGLNYLYGDHSTKYEADPNSYGGAMQIHQGLLGEAEKNKVARDALYTNIRNNAFTAGKRGFDENKERAARENKFALFAQGLQGGSVDVDENALIDRTYRQGLLDLGAKADAAKADVQNSDEQARLQLLQSIDAGMDEGSAVSSALGQLKVNSDRAAANAQGTALGDLFGNAGLLYTKSQAARGKQAAGDFWSSMYPKRTTGASTNNGSSGTVYKGPI